ncbi:MAG: hemerythrin family protein [Rhodospirillales bacterium]|jgi:hemerythrin|nr:hemerythrin family protein [Rhodospirillales bacterium]
MNTSAHIEWQDAFATGIPSVDFEHQELIKLVNGACEMMNEKASSDQITESLGEVFAHVSAHFALEETIMRKMKYEDYHDHKEDHENLLDDIRDIMDDYEAGEFSDSPDVYIVKLNNWFLGHFSTKDAKLHRMTHK